MLDFYRRDEPVDTTDDSESGLPACALADVNRIMVGENAAWLPGHFLSHQNSPGVPVLEPYLSIEFVRPLMDPEDSRTRQARLLFGFRTQGWSCLKHGHGLCVLALLKISTYFFL